MKIKTSALGAFTPEIPPHVETWNQITNGFILETPKKRFVVTKVEERAPDQCNRLTLNWLNGRTMSESGFMTADHKTYTICPGWVWYQGQQMPIAEAEEAGFTFFEVKPEPVKSNGFTDRLLRAIGAAFAGAWEGFLREWSK